MLLREFRHQAQPSSAIQGHYCVICPLWISRVCWEEAPCRTVAGNVELCTALESRGFASHFFVLYEYIEIVPVFLDSWYICLSLKQLLDLAGALLSAWYLPMKAMSCVPLSARGLHWLQYTDVNKRQLQSYIPVIAVLENQLQKRQSAQGLQRVWKCLSNTCNE